MAVTVAAALHPAAGADRRLLARAAESAIHLTPVRAPARRPATGARVVRQVAPVGAELDLAA